MLILLILFCPVVESFLMLLIFSYYKELKAAEDFEAEAPPPGYDQDDEAFTALELENKSKV